MNLKIDKNSSRYWIDIPSQKQFVFANVMIDKKVIYLRKASISLFMNLNPQLSMDQVHIYQMHLASIITSLLIQSITFSLGLRLGFWQGNWFTLFIYIYPQQQFLQYSHVIYNNLMNEEATIHKSWIPLLYQLNSCLQMRGPQVLSTRQD